MAYSLKIHDPAFDIYLKNTKDYRFQFAFALAIIAIAGFYLYGEMSDELENPEALYIGLGIGGMFFFDRCLFRFFRKERANLGWGSG